MKVKNFFQFLGFRGKAQHYTYVVNDIDLGNESRVHYAQWQHPKETKKTITNEMIDAYREILNEGDFCIDIGAHTGDSTLPMALAVKKEGCVLAFEPNPYLYHVLEKNVRVNLGVANIRTIMAAASTSEGFLEFEYSDSGFCNGGRHEGISAWKHGHPFKLEVFGVDVEKELNEDFSDFLPSLKFVKVDAEGYDLFVLRSMTNIIKAYRPIVKTEVFKNTNKKYRIDLLTFFQDLNYSSYKIIEEPIKPGPLLTEENIEEWRHYDILSYPNKES